MITKNNLGNILIAKFFGALGSEMLSFAIGLYVLQKTGSALGMGISLITGPLVNVVMTPIIGYIVDTVDHKKVMIMAQIGTILALIGFIFFFKNFTELYFVELVILIALLSISDGFLSTAIRASLSRLFPQDDLEKANSLNQSVTSLAEFLAPVLGAVVYTLVSLDTFAYIEIILETVALIAITLLFFPETSTDHLVNQHETELAEGSSVIANFVGGLKYLWKNKTILLLVGSSSFINFFFATINLGLPFLMVDQLHLSNSQYGMTESAFAGGMILGGLMLSRLHFKTSQLNFAYFSLIVFSLLVAALGLPALILISKVGYTIIFSSLNFILGILLVFSYTPVEVYMQQKVPEKVQGRVFVLGETLSTILMPLGTIVFGALFDRMNVFLVFLIGAIPILVVAISVLVILGKDGKLKSNANESF